MKEEERLAKYSNANLRRNILPREAKKLNMEFDPLYSDMNQVDRDALLDKLYPEDKAPSADAEPK